MSSPENHTNQASQRWQLTNSLLDEGFSFLDASLAYRTVGNDPQKAIDFLNCRNIVSNPINVALSQRHNAVDQDDDTLHTEEVQEESQAKLSPNAINTITQHPMCLCGNVLRKCQVQYACMNGGNSVQCNLCQTHLNDAHELLYHCPTNKTPLYPSGYDLCLICAQKQIDDPQGFQTAQNRVIPAVAQPYVHMLMHLGLHRNDMYTNAPNIEGDFDDIYEHSDKDNTPEILRHPGDETQAQNVLHEPQKDTILQTAIALHQDTEDKIVLSEVQHCDDTDHEDEMLQKAIALSHAADSAHLSFANNVCKKGMDEDDSSDCIYGFTDDEEPMGNDAEVACIYGHSSEDTLNNVEDYEWEWSSHMQSQWHPYSREINTQLNRLKKGEDMCASVHGHWYSFERIADNVATQRNLATNRIRHVRTKQPMNDTSLPSHVAKDTKMGCKEIKPTIGWMYDRQVKDANYQTKQHMKDSNIGYYQTKQYMKDCADHFARTNHNTDTPTQETLIRDPETDAVDSPQLTFLKQNRLWHTDTPTKTCMMSKVVMKSIDPQRDCNKGATDPQHEKSVKENDEETKTNDTQHRQCNLEFGHLRKQDEHGPIECETLVKIDGSEFMLRNTGTTSPKSNESSSHSSGNNGDDEEEQYVDTADESNESTTGYHQTKMDPQRDCNKNQGDPPQVKSHKQTVEYDTLLGSSNTDDGLDSKKPNYNQIEPSTLLTELSDMFDDSFTSDSECVDYEYTRAQIVDQLKGILMDLKQAFTADNSGIISCPLPSSSPNNSNTSTSNSNKQGKHNPDGNMNTHDGNNNCDKQRKKSNSNDGRDDEDETDVSMSESAPCNHLNTCSDCRRGWTQKCEQIKSQHIRYVSFIESLAKVIANAKQKGNKKSKSKKRRKMAHTVTANQSRYCPPFDAKQSLSVAIPNTFVEDMIAPTVKEPVTSHSYLYKSIAMQHNDKQLDMNQTNVVVNMDLHEEKSNESLYCVMSKIQHERCNWQLVQTLCTKKELGPTILPISSREALRDSIYYPIPFNTQSVNDIFAGKFKWNTIPVFNIQNNIKRLTLFIEQNELNPMIKRTLLNADGANSFTPILMFDRELHWVEHVVIVHIAMSRARKEDQKVDQVVHDQLCIDICVSLRCDAHSVRITGIHLDKQKISEQHQLLRPHECHCLDGFNSTIHDIRVGNPDTLKNQLKAVKSKYDAYKEFMLCFIDSHRDKFHILQQQAEVLLMNENGTLGHVVKSMDFEPSVLTSPSISSSPDYCLNTLKSD